MPRIAQKYSRRQQVFKSLAHMLEVSPGERITTAGLAKAVGVSEAALYRHFPSKAKMFEGLIEFAEMQSFRMTVIINEEQNISRPAFKSICFIAWFCGKKPWYISI